MTEVQRFSRAAVPHFLLPPLPFATLPWCSANACAPRRCYGHLPRQPATAGAGGGGSGPSFEWGWASLKTSLVGPLDPQDSGGYIAPPSRTGCLRKYPQKRCREASLKSFRTRDSGARASQSSAGSDRGLISGSGFCFCSSSGTPGE
jgi:hypothetical protein